MCDDWRPRHSCGREGTPDAAHKLALQRGVPELFRKEAHVYVPEGRFLADNVTAKSDVVGGHPVEVVLEDVRLAEAQVDLCLPVRLEAGIASAIRGGKWRSCADGGSRTVTLSASAPTTTRIEVLFLRSVVREHHRLGASLPALAKGGKHRWGDRDLHDVEMLLEGF